MKINTVLGPVDSSELGTTLMHEHITFADWSMREEFGNRFFEEPAVEDTAAAEFAKVKSECGVSTVVDATPINVGRDISLIRNVARRSGVNIIVSSGFYYQEEPSLENRSESSVYELLLSECKEGIAGTDVFPGMMKAASAKDGMTPFAMKMHRATGRVAAEMDMPIFCHHDPATKCGPKIVQTLEEVGMKPEKIIIGHAGDTTDLDYLHDLLELGCYIGLDRFGYCAFDNSLEARVDVAVKLCREGFANQLILSHDLAVYMGVFEDWNQFKDGPMQHMSPDYTYLHKTVLPMLETGGVTQADIDQMLNKNPRNIFEGKKLK